jgi:CRP-like cAMP-binding protein
MLPATIAGTKEHRVTDIRLNRLGPGDCFGEYGLIDGQPASASVIALQPGSLLKLSRDSFERLLAANDRMAKIIYCNLLRLLIGRLRKREKEYDLVLLV